ncbi:MAG: tRNA (N(6)-L-threonylcarbamoyladenosine(37)-C(2))-methylthiotransferase MtaB [Chloroflexi bacterium]|nr:tRNA (N(6)-L-threonylcarbamoyladenosine(37)-C(2))-methylthiotransferase MtaB [Chloroflexota bacterium]MCL5074042.1 tRNA (N(6)-L-threonylcarbamoyladenosine(37)-C(2))-methylthiotransferase MtaB [Chloroflexota bacterium]
MSIPNPTVAIATLGCKVNQAESDGLGKEFRLNGFRLVPFTAPADIYIINTCTVTHMADRKSRQLIRQARRRNRQSLIVVTGCYVRTAPEEVAATGDVDLIVTSRNKVEILTSIRQATLSRRTDEGSSWPLSELSAYPVRTSKRGLRTKLRTRAFLKIQDGCSKFCSYCIVPFARGQEHSIAPDTVLTDIRELVEQDYQEVVLCGIRLGKYGQDLAPHTNYGLADLVGAILRETSCPRLRLSSVEPQDFDPSLLNLWPNPRLCRHFHLPLQSGSDAVLQRMRRGYDTASFLTTMHLIRQAIPDVAITTDMIVGFPGETNKEFEESYHFAKEASFARIHVFNFSPRCGTPAAAMPGQVPEAAKKVRSEMLLKLAKESGQRFRAQFVGTMGRVLYEQRMCPREQAKVLAGTEFQGLYDYTFWEGLTDNYIRVYTKTTNSLANKIVDTRLVGELSSGLLGELFLCAADFLTSDGTFCYI